jgi:hypothetical protein
VNIFNFFIIQTYILYILRNTQLYLETKYVQYLRKANYMSISGNLSYSKMLPEQADIISEILLLLTHIGRISQVYSLMNYEYISYLFRYF